MPLPARGRERKPSRSASRPRFPLIGLALLALAACGPSGRGDFTQKTKSLEVVSWWTSGSESAALNVLFDQFRLADPGVTVESAAIQGGAGSNVQIALAKRLREDNPPDVWQTFPGAALRATAESGRIADVSALFEKNGLAQDIPAPILDALTWNGKRWGVPTGAHRQNMLWFNPKVLKTARVAAPVPGYTAARFVADLGVLKVSGVTPLCLGIRDRFTTTELFENILLGTIGDQGWADIAADRFNWSGPAVQTSLDQLGQILDHIDAGAALTWDAAAKQLAEGKCAFLSMNDSLYGELVADGIAVPDIGSVPFPGTEGSFLAIVDTFVVAKNAKNGANALQFLATVGSAPAELAFAKVKGSAPLRKDVDGAALPAYQQAASKALNSGTILLSITHGELLAPQFQQGFYDGVAAFAQSRNPKAFTDKIQQVVSATVPVGH